MGKINKKLKDLYEKTWSKHRDALGLLIKHRPQIDMHAGGLLKLLEDNDYKTVKLFAPLKLEDNKPFPFISLRYKL